MKLTIEPDDMVCTLDDSYTEILKQLLLDISELRLNVDTRAKKRLESYKAAFRSEVFSKSALNLAHYLALRHYDLRHLQLRLAQAGLSSLGRAESSVMSTLDSVIYLLENAISEQKHSSTAKNPTEYGFSHGQQLLEQHTLTLFGPYIGNSKAHVMVTLDVEAANNYQQVRELMTKGMTCARINCAHDDATTWLKIIRNIRRAEVEMGRVCRVMMDLAGHKLRTGKVTLGLAIHHLKTQKDVSGTIIKPCYIIVTDKVTSGLNLIDGESVFTLTIPSELIAKLKPKQLIHFTDVRHKKRILLVEKKLSNNEWLLSCDKGAYLAAGSEFELIDTQSTDSQIVSNRYQIGDFDGAPLKIRLFKNEHILLTDASKLGKPAEYDSNNVQIRPAQIGCTLDSVIDRVKVGEMVWIDDGKLGAVAEKIDSSGILLRVTEASPKGVNIKSDKGINFPDTDLKLPSLSEKDLLDLDFVSAHADLVGFSFVETLDDINVLVSELAKRNATNLPIIAKIETNKAVKNLPDIILGTIGNYNLGVMIARGDLSVELGSARLAEVQEELLWLCESAHVPVIWATQVLESIAKKGTRSRPEFTDAAMAVRAECVMLNKGPFIADALEDLVNVMVRMQAHQHKKFPRLRALHW
ncbi:MAG: pyruvate kinase [Gammaproteobacteria bacterium]|nr:pyruvate kinase [Gammaproteobacteria bacterium]